MYWYGWMAAAIAAFVAAAISCFIPERLTQRLWSGWSWVIPLAVMVIFSYLLSGLFTC